MPHLFWDSYLSPLQAAHWVSTSLSTSPSLSKVTFSNDSVVTLHRLNPSLHRRRLWRGIQMEMKRKANVETPQNYTKVQ